MHSAVPDSENGYLLNYQDEERARMQIQHDLIKAYMGKLILAPIDLTQSGLRVLDSGTFDALWLRDISTILTSPILTGTDVSATAFPPPSTLPPNTTLHVQSIADPWPAAWQETFDLVHQKLVIACLPPPQGRKALGALIALAKPGTGYVQFTEGSLEHLTEPQKKQFPVLARFQATVAEMLPLLGWNPRPGKLVREWVAELGCVDVQEKVMEIGIGAGNEDRKLGGWAMRNMVETVRNFREAAGKLPAGSKVSAADFEGLVEAIEEEFATVGGILRYNTVWGRRA
ncbi:N-methyltransferase gliN [Aspergillus stella-maris]|uniref:N-methyltransferase gliN n=1 Tax=Aspergillus stella-maris TaxID=1810926 RepID=UPI003CCC8FEA